MARFVLQGARSPPLRVRRPGLRFRTHRNSGRKKAVATFDPLYRFPDVVYLPQGHSIVPSQTGCPSASPRCTGCLGQSRL